MNTRSEEQLVSLLTSFVRLTSIIAPNLPSEKWDEIEHYDIQDSNAPCILSALYDCLSLSRNVAYISLDASLDFRERQSSCVQDDKCKITMARWKSGLFPLVVLAIKVNCDTHRTSPPISLTLAFHILSGSLGSLKTLNDKLVFDRELAMSGLARMRHSHFICYRRNVGHGIICPGRNVRQLFSKGYPGIQTCSDAYKDH